MSKAFGEQNPTQGEDAVSWQTWHNGVSGSVVVIGDPDWGKLKLDLNGEEGRSDVVDLGAAVTRKFTLTENRYGTGAESATIQIRGDTSPFVQDDSVPAWETYNAPISKGYRYVQVRATTQKWYLPNGIILSDVVAAYAAKGAASYAASKINLANPGTYNLTEVATSLNWDAILGWNDANKALTSSGFLLTNFTFIIKFSGIVEFGGCGYIPASLYSVIDSEYGLITCRDIGEGGPYAVRYGSDTYNAIVEPDLLQGTIAFTNNHTTNKMQGYRNGVADGTLFDTDVSGVDTLFIMNYPNYEEVQSIALYNKVLTQSQIQEVGANMP